MQNRKHNEWIWPPADQWLMVWGGFVLLLVMVLTSELFRFFSRLTGGPWIWCYFIGLAVATLGVSLLFYAKLPLYRQRRFFTFGNRALPARRRPYYRWGYRCILIGVALLGCLLLSNP
jgi:hypothetical protein